jgi:hypothetical protein
MTWMAAAAIAAPIVTGLLGQDAAKGQRQAAEDAARRSAEAFSSIELPDIEKQRLMLERYQSAGELNLTPEQLAALGPTALENIAPNPKYNEYTMNALQKMSSVAEQGLPEVDRAQLQALLDSTNQQNTSNQKAILENRAARGMGGSGNELAAQLQAAQSGANTSSNQALQLASIAAQRKLDATGQTAGLAQALSNTDYNQQANLANKRDAISQFNTQNQQQVTGRNVDRTNQAIANNLQNRQSIANQNTGLSNQQQTANKSLEQQQFQNKVQKAGGTASGQNALSQYNSASADATGKIWAGIGTGISTGLAGLKEDDPKKTEDTTKKTADTTNTTK